MPVYEYICKACSEKFSLLQRVSSGENETQCTKCSSREVRKVMSSFCCSSGSGSGLSSSVPSHGFGGGG